MRTSLIVLFFFTTKLEGSSVKIMFWIIIAVKLVLSRHPKVMHMNLLRDVLLSWSPFDQNLRKALGGHIKRWA